MAVIATGYHPRARMASRDNPDMMPPYHNSADVGLGSMTVVAPLDRSIVRLVGDAQMVTHPATTPGDTITVSGPSTVKHVYQATA